MSYFSDETHGSPASSERQRYSLWRMVRPVRTRLGWAMALSALSTLLSLGALLSLAATAAALLEDATRWPWRSFLAATGCVVGSYALRLLAFSQSHYAAFHLEAHLRERLARHLTRVALGSVQRYGTGALSKIMLDDVKALHVFVADSTPLYARALAAPAGALLLSAWLDWRLAATAIAVPMAGAAVLVLAMRRSAPMHERYNRARERVSASVIEFVQAMPVVRTFDSGSSAFGRYQRALDNYLDVLTRWYRQAGFAARFSFAVLNPLPTLLALLWVGYGLMRYDAVDTRAWMGVLLLGCGMAEAMLPLMMLNQLIAKANISLRRIEDVLRLPLLPESALERQPADASVTFEQVTFHYDPPPAAPALRNISFHVPAGSIAALVGRSGAGKSTVARLIPRFWDVTSGRILIGGVDIREISMNTLMRQVAFVFQENTLFADTIANNIRLGQPDKSLSEVMAAARSAQAHDFIVALPHGYDTPVGELGHTLSGGQRQRIALARAILQDRPILVLDEATAFADPENEAALVSALSALIRGKTTIVAAHRLATVCDADRILVFERGDMVEQGRHEALLAERGRYYRLWENDRQAQCWSLRRAGEDTHEGEDGR